MSLSGLEAMQDYIAVDVDEKSFLYPNSSQISYNTTMGSQSLFSGTEKTVLIVAYTFVFCCCIFGNLLVMVVVFLQRRLRTVTNFFLTNLAVADFCVGVFCVFQNLSLYLMDSWPFGNFLCKMYHFIQSLSYNTSIAILMVICVERYVAIIYPLWSKQAVTLGRLRAVITIVWLVSALYCSPRLIMYGTAELPSVSGSSVECFMQRRFYDSEIYDIANFVFLLVIPLVVIVVLYSKIAIHLWKSSVDSMECGEVELRHVRQALSKKSFSLRESHSNLHLCYGGHTGSLSHVHGAHFVVRKNGGICVCHEIRLSVMDESELAVREHCCYCNMTRNIQEPSTSGTRMNQSSTRRNNHGVSFQQHCLTQAPKTIIRARRKVLRLLLAVVLCFAFCNLPFHVRKLWQYWSPHFDGTSKSSVFFTMGTTLLLYFNSGINPILYAFLSENFRNSMKEVMCCRRHPVISRFASCRSTPRAAHQERTVIQTI
ncbi:trissin receptor-like [Limulus polyphemus]|uniref:Trissin receptor-like n=1 Tax=Limulus polyphemus TaxID=6850 RepID=A0ABM1RVK1_LIMPO|nr:trissin receptor-like [Limulus polyphemus]